MSATVVRFCHVLYSPFTKVAEKYNIKHINSITQLAYLFKMTFNAFWTIWDECFEFYWTFYCYYCILSTIIDIFILDGKTKKNKKKMSKMKTPSSAGLKFYFLWCMDFLKPLAKIFLLYNNQINSHANWKRTDKWLLTCFKSILGISHSGNFKMFIIFL